MDAPDRFVIMSTPGEHSRKPHLGPLLLPFLPPHPRCAEVSDRLSGPALKCLHAPACVLEPVVHMTLTAEGEAEAKGLAAAKK